MTQNPGPKSDSGHVCKADDSKITTRNGFRVADTRCILTLSPVDKRNRKSESSVNPPDTDKLNKARESVQDAIDATDVAIAKQAAVLRKRIKEIEALLDASSEPRDPS
jgi:hypothetical protein